MGTRNLVLVLSMVSCSNTVVSRIAMKTGAVPITHEFGCVEFEDDHRRTKMALVAAGRNPNVYGVLLVGLGCEQILLADVKQAIATTGKPVEGILIQEEGGSPEAEARGIEIVRKLQEEAERQPRVPCSAGGLVVGVQCGGSDWTTAVAGNTVIGAMADHVIENGGSVLMSEVMGFPGSEQIVAANAVSREVALQILDMVTDLRAEYVELYGQTIEEVNPTPGNKAGGITTLVEKSMGNVRKMGRSPVQGVLQLGDPIPHPGLWVVDNRAQGPDPFNVTGFAIQGANVTVLQQRERLACRVRGHARGQDHGEPRNLQETGKHQRFQRGSRRGRKIDSRDWRGTLRAAPGGGRGETHKVGAERRRGIHDPPGTRQEKAPGLLRAWRRLSCPEKRDC